MTSECRTLVKKTPVKSKRRRCKKCKKVKAASKFSNDSTRADGKFPWCMSCQQTSTLPFQNSDDPLNGHICPLCDTPCRGHANRRFCSRGCKERVTTLRNKYGLTPQQYRTLIDDTGGKCPVCGRNPTQWQVEHNHRTGKITGVVCKVCNVGALAMTFHDVELIRRLLSYLEEPPAERLGIHITVPAEKAGRSQIHMRWRYKDNFRKPA